MILHVDGDAFFASVEQAINPLLKNRPVVAGYDRGIAAAISYEAKKFGITRGMPIFQIKSLCPHCVIVHSSYKAYELYSRRVYQIVASYCPHIEVYSIDEVFACLDEKITDEKEMASLAKAIQQEIADKLDISISISIAPSKALAKIGSDLRKPHGCVIITQKNREEILAKVPVKDIWGIGSRLARRLAILHVQTAGEFAEKPETWIQKHFSKKEVELWYELRGISLWPVTTGYKETFKSMMKTATFPHSDNKDHVYAQLVHNVERMWFRLRNHGYRTQTMDIFLKRQDFRKVYDTVTFSPHCDDLSIFMHAARTSFEKIYKKNVQYRTTGVIVSDLTKDGDYQTSLFEGKGEYEKKESVNKAVCAIKKNFGASSIMPASEIPKYNLPIHDMKKNPSMITWEGIKI